jgi:hypothetical protein
MSVQRELREPKFYYELGPYLSELRQNIGNYQKMLVAQVAVRDKLIDLDMEIAGANPVVSVHTHGNWQRIREGLHLEKSKLLAIRSQAEFRINFCLTKMESFWPDVVFDFENGWMKEVQFMGFVAEYRSTINSCLTLGLPLSEPFKLIQSALDKYPTIEENKN